LLHRRGRERSPAGIGDELCAVDEGGVAGDELGERGRGSALKLLSNTEEERAVGGGGGS